TPATTRSSSLRRSLTSGITLMLRRARDLDVPDADACVDQELRRRCADLARHIVTVLVPAEQVRVAPADVPDHPNGCVFRHRHVELPDADTRVDPRRVRAKLELGEVERETSDAEPVAVVKRRRTRGAVGVLADAVAEM